MRRDMKEKIIQNPEVKFINSYDEINFYVISESDLKDWQQSVPSIIEVLTAPVAYIGFALSLIGISTTANISKTAFIICITLSILCVGLAIYIGFFNYSKRRHLKEKISKIMHSKTE